MVEEAIATIFMGSFSVFMLAKGLILLKNEITMESHFIVPEKEEKQTQTQDDEDYPGIEYVEVIPKKTKSSSCLVM